MTSGDSSRAAPLRVGVVGCGAIADQGHLPALAARGLAPAALVDPDRRRRETAARTWGGTPLASVDELIGRCDAAIVAVPPHLHLPVCTTLLAAGVHVLLEKPLVTNPVDGTRLVQSARDAKATLRVGHNRRFMTVNRVVRDLLRTAAPDLQRVHLIEGVVDNWDAATDVHLRRETAGGGVVMDSGVHSLDLLQWWLGPLEVVGYADDSIGGVEANAEMELRTTSGIPVSVEFSRVRELRNTVVLELADRRLEVWLHVNKLVSDPPFSRSRRPKLPEQAFVDLFAEQLRAWFDDINGGQSNLPGADEAARVVALVHDCYDRRSPLTYPWAA